MLCCRFDLMTRMSHRFVTQKSYPQFGLKTKNFRNYLIQKYYYQSDFQTTYCQMSMTRK